MKGGKDEDKVMGPLFPRLHVNDAEKGGPRPPPRNKMALYEQLSVPSERFNSASSSILPRPPHNTTTLVPSASPSQGGGHERSVFSPFYVHNIPAYSTEKLHSRPSDGVNLTSTNQFQRKFMKSGSNKTMNVTGHLLSTVECSSTRSHNFSNSKNSSGKKSADEDDFQVPTFQQGGENGKLNPFPNHPGQSTVTMVNIPPRSITACWNSSTQSEKTCNRPLKRTDIDERKQGRNMGEQSQNETLLIKQGEKNLISHPSAGEKIAEASKHVKMSLNQECTRASLNECESSSDRNTRLCNETGGLVPEGNISAEGVSVVQRCLNGNRPAENENVSMVRSESVSRVLLHNSHRSPNEAENCIEESEGEGKASSLDADRNDDESEISMTDSLSGLDISPDDVVGVIGQRHFWKTRKAILKQQRVFAIQVFELHRLIKVQKLIASSPELLLESTPYLSRPPSKVPAKKLISEYNLESRPKRVKHKGDSQKPSLNTDLCPSEKDGSQEVHLAQDDGVDKGIGQHPGNEPQVPHAGNAQPAPLAVDNRSSPWCFHPPGNQWLVPIMSPSEGLVYKPYMAACPPNVGFMNPIYGGCGPLSLPPVRAYGLPASHQQPGVGVVSGAPVVAQNYFAPAYGMPIMNPPVMYPVMSTSVLEQVDRSSGAQPTPQAEQESTALNFNMHSWSSCNASNQKSEAFSSRVSKSQTSKESEVQGSSASIPCERTQGTGSVAEGKDALSLFPVGPAMEASYLTPHALSGDQQTRVIKVVPRNSRSATASATRILQSIQRERQQYDSL